MTLFMAICQGIGLALAAGSIAGAIARQGAVGSALLVVAVAAGAALFAASLSGNDHVAWPGIPAGAVAGMLGFTVAHQIASGALGRAASGEGQAEGSRIAITGTLILVALAVAALSSLVPPVALVVLAAFGWMALTQRRRGQRKYEGLRVLR